MIFRNRPSAVSNGKLLVQKTPGNQEIQTPQEQNQASFDRSGDEMMLDGQEVWTEDWPQTSHAPFNCTTFTPKIPCFTPNLSKTGYYQLSVIFWMVTVLLLLIIRYNELRWMTILPCLIEISAIFHPAIAVTSTTATDYVKMYSGSQHSTIGNLAVLVCCTWKVPQHNQKLQSGQMAVCSATLTNNDSAFIVMSWYQAWCPLICILQIPPSMGWYPTPELFIQ